MFTKIEKSIIIFPMILIVLMGASFIRNIVWLDDVKLWQEVIRNAPSKARGYMHLGVAYYLEDRADQAIAQHRIAIMKAPGDANSYNNLGLAYAKKGVFDLAVEMYDKAIALNPDFVAAYNNRGRLYAEKKEIDAAIKDYNRAITLDPLYAGAYGNRGIAYGIIGQYDAEIMDFETVISIQPLDIYAYFNLGSAMLNHTGQYEKAIELFSKVISMNRNFTNAYSHRGFAYYKLGHISEAVPDFQKACTMGDGNACKSLQEALAVKDRSAHYK